MALMGSFSERGGGSFTVTLLVTFGTLLAVCLFVSCRARPIIGIERNFVILTTVVSSI